MPGVHVTTLRQHLPEYLARVARGERVLVTLRGRIIAVHGLFFASDFTTFFGEIDVYAE